MMWHSGAPHVANLNIFRCEGYAHAPKEQRRKLNQKATKLIFVEESKAFHLLDKRTNNITISQDIVFLGEKRSESVILSVDEKEKKNETAVEVVFKPLEAREYGIAAVEDDETPPEEDRSNNAEDTIDAGISTTNNDNRVAENQEPKRLRLGVLKHYLRIQIERKEDLF